MIVKDLIIELLKYQMDKEVVANTNDNLFENIEEIKLSTMHDKVILETK